MGRPSAVDGLHATGCVVLTGGDPEWGDLVDGGEVVVTEREPYQVLDIPSPCDSVGPCRSSGSFYGHRGWLQKRPASDGLTGQRSGSAILRG